MAGSRHGIHRISIRRLTEATGVDRRTVERWVAWWRDEFPVSPTGRFLRAQVVLADPSSTDHAIQWPDILIDAFKARSHPLNQIKMIQQLTFGMH